MANKHPNQKGLKPANKQSKKEARKNGKKGGIASGKARAEKKALKDTLKTLMELPIKPGSIDANLKSLSEIKDRNLSAKDAMAVAMIKAAVSGNTRAFEIIRDTIGEAPVKELQVEQVIPQPLAPIKASDAPDNRL